MLCTILICEVPITTDIHKQLKWIGVNCRSRQRRVPRHGSEKRVSLELKLAYSSAMKNIPKIP